MNIDCHFADKETVQGQSQALKPDGLTLTSILSTTVLSA